MVKWSKKIKIIFGILFYLLRLFVYDYLVGNDGVFNEMVKGLINVGNLGINIEFRVILILVNYIELDDIVEFVGCVFFNIN